MTRPSLPALEDFEHRFRATYGRAMTAEEKRFFELTEAMLQEPTSEEQDRRME